MKDKFGKMRLYSTEACSADQNRFKEVKVNQCPGHRKSQSSILLCTLTVFVICVLCYVRENVSVSVMTNLCFLSSFHHSDARYT